jgi:hypothetical protein
VTDKETPSEVSTLTTTHECPSCGAFIFNARRYEGHEPTCMQPELRMRRLEARVQASEEEARELKQSLMALAHYLLFPGSCLAPNGDTYCGGSDLCANCCDGGKFAGDCGIAKELCHLIDLAIEARRPR